jgi:hypothetical protein
LHISFRFLVFRWIIVTDLALNHLVKKLVDTLGVAVEIVLSIRVIYRDALREVDYGEFGGLLIGYQVELVVVSVDQSVLGESH